MFPSVSQHALGVEVFDGMESVQLPCQVNVSVSMESTVVWSREDLRFSTVHIHQQSGDDLSEQNPRYSNRTMMSKDALQTGDLSLTLKNPTVSDSETYTCTVRRFGRELSRIHVHLQVKGWCGSKSLWDSVVLPNSHIEVTQFLIEPWMFSLWLLQNVLIRHG